MLERKMGMDAEGIVTQEAVACLENFAPVRGRFDRALFTYGPLWVLVQLNATGIVVVLSALYGLFHPEPQMHERRHAGDQLWVLVPGRG